jgi:hypothetical protein
MLKISLFKKHIVACIITIVFAISGFAQPHPYKTFSHINKNRNGGYCTYEQLKKIFNNEVDTTTIGIRRFNNSYRSNEALIIINQFIYFSQKELDALRSYLEKGNDVLVSGVVFDNLFEQEFKVAIPEFNVGRLYDSVKIKIDPTYISPNIVDKEYQLKSSWLNNFVEKMPYSATAIGYNSRAEKNFIKLPVGSGNLYIHTAPYVFSNQFLLKNNNYEYTETVLSVLKIDADKVFFDEHNYYYQPNSGSRASTIPNHKNQTQQPPEKLGPLDFILKNPPLKYAGSLLLFLIGLAALFAALRKQRPIPLIAPVKNNSKEFISTIKDVYYKEKDNKIIADKMLLYFLDNARTKYNISNGIMEPEFWEKLGVKSQMAQNDFSKLKQITTFCNNNFAINKQTLMQLNQSLEKFYKI